MQNSFIKVNPRSRPKTPVIPDKETLKAALTEFISTFIFVFAGSGSGTAVDKLAGDGDAPSALIASAIAHAFALSAAVGVSARFSGDPYISCCHANPAVTFGAFVSGNIHSFRGIVFWIAQLLGSIVACLILMLFTGGQRVPDFRVSSGVGVESAVVLEMVMTFGLVYTVYATSVDPKAKVNFDSTSDKTLRFVPLNVLAPLAIGLIVGANVLVGGPFDGASMNPALSFGPALVNWSWANHWVYWIGPLVGAGLAGFIYEFFFINN